MSEMVLALIGDDEKPYAEWLGGLRFRKMSPKHRHSVVQGAFWLLLRDLGKGRGTVGTEWRFHLDANPKRRTSLVPDVAFVSYERWRPLSEDDRQEPPFAPDVAIEIRSPGDKRARIEWKIRAYLDKGSLVVFDVLPKQRRIFAHTTAGVRELGESDVFEDVAVPWLRFEVAEVFAGLEPSE